MPAAFIMNTMLYNLANPRMLGGEFCGPKLLRLLDQLQLFTTDICHSPFYCRANIYFGSCTPVSHEVDSE